MGEALRVVHSGDSALVGGHDDGASDDWPGNRAPPYFIDAREQRAFLGAEVALDRGPAFSPRYELSSRFLRRN
jgi:hypothetical protein